MSLITSPTPLNIIVADDHDWIRQVLVRVVHDTLPEAAVYVATNGVQAFKFYQSRPCHFLVSNHFMPHMNGMDLIRIVRRQQPGLPIVMVSAHPDAEEDAMAAGANWFLPKEQITRRLPTLLLEHATVGN